MKERGRKERVGKGRGSERRGREGKRGGSRGLSSHPIGVENSPPLKQSYFPLDKEHVDRCVLTTS